MVMITRFLSVGLLETPIFEANKTEEDIIAFFCVLDFLFKFRTQTKRQTNILNTFAEKKQKQN